MKARLFVSALCSIAAISSSFAVVNWTGPAVFTNGPMVFDMTTNAPALGAFVTFPSPVVPMDDPLGFRVTQATFMYYVVPPELGHTLDLRWTVNRPLNQPAAIPWQNTGMLDGGLTLPAATFVLQMTMLTTTTDTDAFYSKVVIPGALFTPGASTPFSASAWGGPTTQPFGPDVLLQQFSLQFVGGSLGSPIILDLPNSSTSLAPEPSSLVGLGAAALAVIGTALRRRKA